MSIVPRESLGQARLFRNRVAAADDRIRAAMPAIIGPLRPRVHRTLRPQLAIREIDDALRGWQTAVTDEFTLDGRLRTHRRNFALAELRPTCDRIAAVGWEDAASGQDAISIAWHLLRMRGAAVEFVVAPVATMTLHAVARRIERGDGREHSKIVDDLALLAAYVLAGKRPIEPPPTLPVTAEVPLPGGRWVGQWVTARDAGRHRDFKMFQAQTFLDDEMEYSNAHP